MKRREFIKKVGVGAAAVGAGAAATAGRGFHGGVTIKYRDMLVTEMGAIFSVPVSI